MSSYAFLSGAGLFNRNTKIKYAMNCFKTKGTLKYIDDSYMFRTCPEIIDLSSCFSGNSCTDIVLLFDKNTKLSAVPYMCYPASGSSVVNLVVRFGSPDISSCGMFCNTSNINATILVLSGSKTVSNFKNMYEKYYSIVEKDSM